MWLLLFVLVVNDDLVHVLGVAARRGADLLRVACLLD
jgi:hypothetical protein